MPLVRLLYRSKSLSGLTRDGLDLFIAPIRAASLKNNARQNLTGALAYSEAGFVQALEGEESQVDELLARLKNDPRHRDVVTVDRREIRTRAFPDWAMAFAEIPAETDLTAFSSTDLVRFLIEAAQKCEGVRAIPGFGLAPEARLRTDLGLG